jgi:ATP-dependent Lhr-like helicase
MDPTIKQATEWFKVMGWKPQDFQIDAWMACINGMNGIVNAPTGSGKTYSVLVPAILKSAQQKTKGLRIIWITPIRALAKEIRISAERALQGLGIDWEVGIRTGDTSTTERKKQSVMPPQILITTPESLHMMLATKGYANTFAKLGFIIADEWHELMGSKRGVQVELALSRLKKISSGLQVWGISATIGNLDQAMEVLLGDDAEKGLLIRSSIEKKAIVETLMPDDLEKFPWGGHLGIKLLDKVLPIIHQSKTTLIFTNTRSQCEHWYQKILQADPDMAGLLAMHHGSISQEIRNWVEEQLYIGKLKAVVCTSSLDLGVDFRPVESIVQIGGPKGISRFLQRAGRSGHRPGEKSKIYFVPTHSLEMAEGAALRSSINAGIVEDRIPYIRSFDVLVQYLVTLAVSDGFIPAEIFSEVKTTHAFQSIEQEEYEEVLQFIATGGPSLHGYDEYHKVVFEKGMIKVLENRISRRHRLSIGTIVSDVMLRVKYLGGKNIGSIEESFIGRLNPGDVFGLAGMNLELIKIEGMIAYVRKSPTRKGMIPSWGGGRLPLSAQLGDALREQIYQVSDQLAGPGLSQQEEHIEITTLMPLFKLQQERSIVPRAAEFLIEKFYTDEGVHVLCYPFEGRFVHEGIAALLAHRLGHIGKFSFSIAMNDYGFELLSDQDIPIELAIDSDIFSTDHLWEDIQASINSNQMARRKFRDIATIGGLVFTGYPGNTKADKHLQSSSQLFFEVFSEHEPNHLLLRQAYDEVFEFQLEQTRMRKALERIQHQQIILKYPEKPTPFAYPIMAERIRESYTNESLEDRVRKMQLQFE